MTALTVEQRLAVLEERFDNLYAFVVSSHDNTAYNRSILDGELRQIDYRTAAGVFRDPL